MCFGTAMDIIAFMGTKRNLACFTHKVCIRANRIIIHYIAIHTHLHFISFD